MAAPSTLGTHLRAFTHGHVQQLDRAGGQALAGLAAHVPGLIAGAGAGGIAYLDIDDTIGEVHGYAKQAAAFGYSGVRGLNVQVAVLSTPTAAPVIARARLRRGNVASTGVARMAAQAIGTARAAGASGQLMVRADSAYYGHALTGTVLRARRLVLHHRPPRPEGHRCHRRHSRHRLDGDPLPPGGAR